MPSRQHPQWQKKSSLHIANKWTESACWWIYHFGADCNIQNIEKFIFAHLLREMMTKFEVELRLALLFPFVLLFCVISVTGFECGMHVIVIGSAFAVFLRTLSLVDITIQTTTESKLHRNRQIYPIWFGLCVCMCVCVCTISLDFVRNAILFSLFSSYNDLFSF